MLNRYNALGGQTKRWMDGGRNERTNERTDRWPDGRMDGRTDRWPDGWTNGWTDGQTHHPMESLRRDQNPKENALLFINCYFAPRRNRVKLSCKIH